MANERFGHLGEGPLACVHLPQRYPKGIHIRSGALAPLEESLGSQVPVMGQATLGIKPRNMWPFGHI